MKHGQEEGEAGKPPADQDEVGFRRHLGGVQREDRQEEKRNDHNRDHGPEETGHLRAPVAHTSRHPERGGGRIAVGNGGADDGNIHDNANRRPP